MAYVRMHSPPARHVKRPNKRWDRQRPSTRGAGTKDDHGGADIPPLPTFTSVTPATLVAGAATTTFAVVGTGFSAGAVVTYTAPGEVAKTVTATLADSSHLSFQVPAADLDTVGGITWSVTNLNGDTVGGATITITAA